VEPTVTTLCCAQWSHVARVGPGSCGAQCKTWARGLSEQRFYDLIVFSQPCYTTMVERSY